MKIKNGRRREWARLFLKICIVGALVVGIIIYFRFDRIVGNVQSPLYKDGDLIIRRRKDDAPLLQIRVRGIDD